MADEEPKPDTPAPPAPPDLDALTTPPFRPWLPAPPRTAENSGVGDSGLAEDIAADIESEDVHAWYFTRTPTTPPDDEA